jgi:hypothetical protein
MAFNASDLKLLTSAPQRVFMYSTQDSMGDVLRDGYYTDARLQVGDVIVISGVLVGFLLNMAVTQASGGVATARFVNQSSGGGITVPAAVTNLAGTATSSSQINWTWTLPAGSLLDGQFQLSADAGTTWGTAISLGASQVALSSSGLSASSTYSARVRFRSSVAGGYSPYSNVANASTQGGSTFPNFAPIYFRFAADNPSNITSQVNQSFNPSAVDTTNNRITLGDLGFATFGTYNGMASNPVYFTSSGTLPAPLQANTPYYLSPSSAGVYDIYPTGDTITNLPRRLQGDTVFPAQGFTQQFGKIVFTNQGTGTHVCSSDVLASSIVDLNGGQFTHEARNASDKHSHINIRRDAQNRPYLFSQQEARNHNELSSANNIYGKSSPQGPAGQKFAARQAVGGKRSIIQSYVCQFDPIYIEGVAKVPFASSNVNTITGVLTFNSGGTGSTAVHSIPTATRVRLKADPLATLPSGYSAEPTDYYARAATTTTITLHPTAADATANTNIVMPITSGSGGFIIYAPERAGTGERQKFLTEMLDPGSGGNVLSSGWDKLSAGDNSVIASSDFLTDGRVGAVGRTIIPLGTTPVIKMRLYVPFGATAPTRTDTGQPLAAGTYWVVKNGASSAYSLLFPDTTQGYNDAVAAIGVSNASSTNCIKFSAAGIGFMQFKRIDRPFSLIGTGSTTEVRPDYQPPNGQIGLLTVVIDYNNTSIASRQHRIFWNGIKQAEYLVPDVLGNTTAAVNDGSPAWTLFNSAASHVTFSGRIYEGFYGASTGAILDSDLDAVHNWYKGKYGIA